MGLLASVLGLALCACAAPPEVVVFAGADRGSASEGGVECVLDSGQAWLAGDTREVSSLAVVLALRAEDVLPVHVRRADPLDVAARVLGSTELELRRGRGAHALRARVSDTELVVQALGALRVSRRRAAGSGPGSGGGASPGRRRTAPAARRGSRGDRRRAR